MKKPDRNIWTGKVCRTDSDGNSSLTDIDGSVTRSCREADKESPPAGRKGTFDGRNRLSKVLLRYFRESNKAYAPYPALVTLKQGERTAY